MGPYNPAIAYMSGASMFVSMLVACPVMAQRGPAVVECERAESRNVAPQQAVLGSINPSRRAVIGSAVDGRVVEFLVREGDRVEADQPLAKLLTATIELERDAAAAELDLRRAELLELQNGSLPAEIKQAKARLEAARVVLQYLQKNKQRFDDLGDTRAISVAEFESAVSTWLEANQHFEEAEAAYQLAIDGPRKEKLAQADARIAMQQAIVDKLNDQIRKHTMFSRFAGYVTVEHTEVGQWLPRGEPVAEIIAIDEVDLLAKVPESQIPFVHLGDQVEVQVPALVGRKMAGKIQAIIPEADERSRTFPVKIRITNEMNPQGEMLLKAGMMARVMLPNNEADKVTMVSKDALVLSGATPTIWSIDEASIEADAMQPNRFEANAISIPVRLGREAGDWIEVIGDVSPGALVVKTGNERIPQSRPGAPPSRVTWTVSTE